MKLLNQINGYSNLCFLNILRRTSWITFRKDIPVKNVYVYYDDMMMCWLVVKNIMVRMSMWKEEIIFVTIDEEEIIFYFDDLVNFLMKFVYCS